MKHPNKTKRRIISAAAVLCAAAPFLWISAEYSGRNSAQPMPDEAIPAAVLVSDSAEAEPESPAAYSCPEEAAGETFAEEAPQSAADASQEAAPQETLPTEPNRDGGMVKSIAANRGAAPEKSAGRGNYLGTFRATAYCSCPECSDGWGSQTATGVPARANHTVAVDPSVIKLGSKIRIDGVEYVAEDTGGAIRGNRIDIYFANHAEAVQFGVREKEVYLAD